MGDSNLCKKKFIYEKPIGCCAMKRGIFLLILICLAVPSVSGQGDTLKRQPRRQCSCKRLVAENRFTARDNILGGVFKRRSF